MRIKENIDLEFKRALFDLDEDKLATAYNKMRSLCLKELNEKNLQNGNLSRTVKRLKRGEYRKVYYNKLVSIFIVGMVIGSGIITITVLGWWFV